MTRGVDMAEGDVAAQPGGGAAGLKWGEGGSRPSPPRTWFMMYEWAHLAEGVSVVPEVMILDRCQESNSCPCPF